MATTRGGNWPTSLTRIEPNRIVIRGYAVDEMMGRLDFAEAIYLLLVGELPTPSIGKLFSAVLISSVDHGVTPPSTLATRNVATTGAPLRDAVAAGVLGFGPHHGGDVETCMRFLDEGLRAVRAGTAMADAARATAEVCAKAKQAPPGFGHRIHTRDPRAARLFQMALELELDGCNQQFIRAVERELEVRQADFGRPLPINVDGAIAAICGDLGFDPELGTAVFLISRVPGLVAHAREERHRHAPMRQVDPKDHCYDGPAERRLPETRR